MEFGAILLILAIGLLVGVFISRPFYDRRFETQPLVSHQAVGRSDQDASALLAEKDRILNTLMDLDFDLAMGKTSPEEYPAQRAALLKSGADVLRKLDTIAPAAAAAAVRPARQAESDDEIERLIAARRREMRQAAGSERTEKASGFCPKCGRPVQKADRFCPKCGANL
jgi:hypothetical protein